MINVGTLVTVDLNKARQFRKSHLLQHTGVGMITKMPRIWKRNFQGILGGTDLGSSDPSCWTTVQFADTFLQIPSDYLIIVEEQ